MKNIYTKIGLGLLAAVPLVSFAQAKDLKYLIRLFTEYLNIALELIIALAVLIFVWNVFQYFFTEKDKEKKEAGMYVLYSVVGFFIILSFWGLVNIVRNTIVLDTNVPTIPNLNFGSGGGNAPIKLNPVGGTSNTPIPVNPVGGTK